MQWLHLVYNKNSEPGERKSLEQVIHAYSWRKPADLWGVTWLGRRAEMVRCCCTLSEEDYGIFMWAFEMCTYSHTWHVCLRGVFNRELSLPHQSDCYKAKPLKVHWGTRLWICVQTQQLIKEYFSLFKAYRLFFFSMSVSAELSLALILGSKYIFDFTGTKQNTLLSILWLSRSSS